MAQTTFNKEKSYYLLVGIGKRKEDNEAMAISADDALILKRALHAFDIFSDEKIPPLVNEEATSFAIREKLENLAASTQKEPADLVMIFFSGHGHKSGEDYYLICRNTTEDFENTAIKATDFVKLLKAIQCDKMLILLDCCHAEGMTGQETFFYEEAFKENKNHVMLTACHKTQLSYLSNPVSLFTYALIEGLGGKFLKQGDTDVNIFNLAMDVRERVVALSNEVAELQQPQLNVFKESGTKDFTLVRYPSGGLREIKLLKEEAPSLMKEGSKEVITTTIQSVRDDNYRKQFTWMNFIQEIGNGNYIIQGINGKNVTINSGIPVPDLKDILNEFGASIFKEFVSILKMKDDADSKDLSKKLEYIKFNELKGIIAQGKNDIVSVLVRKRIKILGNMEKESGLGLIALELALDDNTEKLNKYGFDIGGLDDLNIEKLLL